MIHPLLLVEIKLPEREAVELAKQKVKAIESAPSGKSWWSTTDAMTMSSCVLLYSLLVLLLVFLLIKAGKGSEQVLRVFGTILIITTSVFLVVAGYSNDQIAPVSGLLGTIAGYLLGKGQESSRSTRESEISSGEATDPIQR